MVTLRSLQPMVRPGDVYHDSQRVAIIDMGTNSWRVIVVEYVPGLSFKLIDEVQESVRIGEGMAELNVLRPAAMDRAARAAQIFAAFCAASGISDIVAVGTSAIRDAQNQARFLQRIERESGLKVRVLSGEEEAYYGYLAAVNSTTIENGFVMDLGGGSLQIIRVEDRKAVRSISFPLGVVRLTEGFLTSDPVTAKETGALADVLRERLKSLDWFAYEDGMQLIGEGGNVRLVARLQQKRVEYPLDIIHGYEMQSKEVAEIGDVLARATVAQRRRIDGMKPERADISLAGALVLQGVMRAGGFERVVFSGQGVREGLFYERFFAGDEPDHPPIFADVRQSNVLNLGHVYRFQEVHARHITHLTTRMFDQLPPDVHNLRPQEREVLWAASMLHDIGMAIDYNDHHRHGSYLVLNSGLPGYTHREIALIALLIRYHRRGKPSLDDMAALCEPKDDRRLEQMTAMLRLAEQIDRARDGAVKDLRLTVTGGRCIMELVTQGDEQVPLWAVERHRDLFTGAFGLPVEFVPVPA
ncbi:MAG: Ppx/GppA family phosphatase [Anaerolineae bacterium]|nr:Ppx/GppA family phosphatase [Anaerolineae bacterium]